MTAKPFPPVFATNRPASGETVADEVNRLLGGVHEQYTHPAEIAIATAYFNPQGFNLIADEVEKAPVVRLMIGAEPQETFDQAHHSSPIDLLDQSLRDARNLIGFTLEADRAARRMLDWLKRAAETGVPIVEVRRYQREFLHGKAFIAIHPQMPAVLAGSSNLTQAGLTTNRELNLGYPAGQYSGLVIDWFEELWSDAEPFDLAGFYEERWKPHKPWIVFLRMLHELYGSGPADADFAERVTLPLITFQRDGVARALRLLKQLGGVLVCDEVGLGKTFIAGEIIAQATRRQRQEVLVIVPAALKESTWEPFLRKYEISRKVDVISYDMLRSQYENEEGYKEGLQKYGLVVIDEAHNLRNRNTLRAEVVQDLVRGEFRKNVVLLTATPVNNSLDDLLSLVNYFIPNDSQFAHLGMPSIAQYIKDAQLIDPETLSPEHLFDLMDQVAVRRTRKFVQEQYPNTTIKDERGNEVPLEFPQPHLKRLDYSISPEGLELLEAVIFAIGNQEFDPLLKDLPRNLRSRTNDPKRLSMARYMPSLFAKDDDLKPRQVSSAGLLESALLKRLESSTLALRNTLNKMQISHETFLEALEHDLVLIGKDLNEFQITDEDDFDWFLEKLERDEDGSDDAKNYEKEYLQDRIKLDIKLLIELQEMADAAMEFDDGKAERILSELENIAGKARTTDPGGATAGDRRKVIIYSSFVDTIQDLRERTVIGINKVNKKSALNDYKDRVPEAIFGTRKGTSQSERAKVLANFAPRTAGQIKDDGESESKDKWDVLFTTDVLSEGVNLQQAGQMISVDLPWNPMRLVQRHGRIDRIGSSHRDVYVGCFFPNKHLEEFLHLEETLQRKISYANAAVGVTGVIPNQNATPNDVILTDAVEKVSAEFNEVRKLAAGDESILVSRGGNAALSGEEYRHRLGAAIEKSAGLKKEMSDLPFGSGSGFITDRIRHPGWVFCARIGNHPKPWFRFVGADKETWSPLLSEEGLPHINNDTLTSLIAADPKEESTEFFMPEGATEGVYAAWKLALDDIHEKWSFMTDAKNLKPDIPKALREADDLINQYGEHLPSDEQQDLKNKLNAKWPNDIVSDVREIVRSEKTGREKLEELIVYVRETGLTPPEKIEPLPKVSRDDIQVVCWMAVTPQVRD